MPNSNPQITLHNRLVYNTAVTATRSMSSWDSPEYSTIVYFLLTPYFSLATVPRKHSWHESPSPQFPLSDSGPG